MKKKFRSQLKAVLSAAVLLAVTSAGLSLNSHASERKEGGGSTGGGNAVGNVLFDFYENKGSVKIDDPRALPVWKSHVEPVLARIGQLVPDFVTSLEAGIPQKKWYFEPKSLDESQCLNRSIVRVGRGIIACQSPVDVRISKSWFQSPKVEDEQRAGLIMHELLVFLALQPAEHYHGVPTDFHVRDLNRTLFFENPSAEELRKQIEDYGFGTFMTAEEAARVEADKRAFIDGVCEARDPAGVTYDRYEALLEAITERKGSSHAERDTRFKLGTSIRSMFFAAPFGNFAEGCKALRQSL